MKRLSFVLVAILAFTCTASAQSVTNTFGIQWNANNTMAVSTAGNARIRFNSGTGVFEQSLNGGAYTTLGGGSTTLQQAYTNGVAGPQAIIFDSTRLGLVLVDATPTIAATLFAVRNNAQTVQYIKVNTIAGVNNMSFTTPTANNTTGMIFDTVNDYTGSGFSPFVWRSAGQPISNFKINSATQNEFDLFAGSSGNLQTQIITDTSTTGFQLLVGSMPTNTTGALLQTNVADGASSIGTVLNNSTTLANATAKLLDVQNGGVEKWFLTVDGWIQTPVGGNFKILSPSGLGVIQTDDATIGTRVAYSTSNITLAGGTLINFNTACNQTSSGCFSFQSQSVNISTSGANAFKITPSTYTGYLFMASGTATFGCSVAEDLTGSGATANGDAVCWAGTDGKTVATCGASLDLTTVAGVVIVGGANGATIQVCKHGRVVANAEAGITVGQPVGTSATTAGRVSAGAVPGGGALIGHAADATNGNGEGANKVYVDVNL